MMKRRMWSLALGLVCVGMTLSVSGHAGWAPQKPQPVASMSSLDLAGLKKPITKRFVNAKLSEVLAWLSLEKFSFVADVSEFPDQGMVTLNFQSQPLGAVLDAIADAYHGRWERRGDIFTLRSLQSERFHQGAATIPAVGGLLGRTSAPTVAAPRTVTPPPLLERSKIPLISGAKVVAPDMALPSATSRGLTVAPALPVAPRTLDIPLLPTRRALDVAVTAGPQDPKAQEQAMREAEKAMKAAEEAIRKMHESGEWRQAMEKAMQHAHGQHSEEMKKAMEEVHRAMREMHQSKEWKEAWAKAREEIARAIKSGKVTEGGKERPMTAEEKQKLEKMYKNFEKAPEFKFDENFMKKFEGKAFAMPKIDEKMLERMKFDEKTFVMPKIDPKAFEELHKLQGKAWAMPEKDKQALEKLMKEHKTFVMPKIDPKAFEELHKLQGKTWTMPEKDKQVLEKLMKEHKTFVMPKIEGRTFTFTTPHMGEADREARIQQRIQEMRRRSGAAPDATFRSRFEAPSIQRLEAPRAFTFDSNRMRINELLDSLTAAQKEKQEKQGYLTLADLTPKQREMLGDIPKEGNWTFSYHVDGKKVTIKAK